MNRRAQYLSVQLLAFCLACGVLSVTALVLAAFGSKQMVEWSAALILAALAAHGVRRLLEAGSR